MYTVNSNILSLYTILNTVHYTLYTIYCILLSTVLYTVYCKLISTVSTLCTVYSFLLYCILYGKYCIFLSTVQQTVFCKLVLLYLILYTVNLDELSLYYVLHSRIYCTVKSGNFVILLHIFVVFYWNFFRATLPLKNIRYV